MLPLDEEFDRAAGLIVLAPFLMDAPPETPPQQPPGEAAERVIRPPT
jgi:hypothetical protein